MRSFVQSIPCVDQKGIQPFTSTGHQNYQEMMQLQNMTEVVQNVTDEIEVAALEEALVEFESEVMSQPINEIFEEIEAPINQIQEYIDKRRENKKIFFNSIHINLRFNFQQFFYSDCSKRLRFFTKKMCEKSFDQINLLLHQLLYRIL